MRVYLDYWERDVSRSIIQLPPLSKNGVEFSHSLGRDLPILYAY